MFAAISVGPVAQLVEHLTFNQRVSGSNPDGLTKIFPDICHQLASGCTLNPVPTWLPFEKTFSTMLRSRVPRGRLFLSSGGVNQKMLRLTVLIMSLAFAAEAAGQGEALYKTHCATCHSLTLRGSAHGSPLLGEAFLTQWGNTGADEFLEYTSTTMPPGRSGKVSLEDHKAINAFIIARNQANSNAALPLFGQGSSETDLDAEEDAEGDAEGDSVAWSGAGAVEALARSRAGFENQVLPTYAPVTQQMLENPSDGDWLSWRRTLDGHGYSPLDEINVHNVGELRLAWSLAMTDGSNQGTPLVHDGVMFLTHPTNMIQAVDAISGDVLWEYSYDYPAEARVLGGPTRNIAIYDDKIFLATYDAAIVAIDAQTGGELWRTEKADYREAYTHSAGPIIGDGVVLSGINGCELYTKDGCFVTGHDPDTGEELWRTSTIAAPGQHGGDTWAGLPVEFRAGGDMWIAGSYDAELRLFVIGTSQPKPWVAASRGMTPQDHALYTNATLAIDPKTGEIKWYFQHVPGETIDMEVGFERVLVDIDGQAYVLTIGKDGILWKLNLETGAYVDLLETLPQTVFKNVNRETGIVTYRDDIMAARVNDTFSACPGIYGGHNWQAAAYVPSAQALVIPLHQTCSDMTGRPVEQVLGGGGFGGGSTTYPMPGHNDNLGALVSVNVDTMTENWRTEQRAMFLTGALTTGGGLTFIGDLDRYFKAFDNATGKEIWSTRLTAPLHGYPVTYSAGGKQYVAVQTGIGVFRALTGTLAPDIYQPVGGQAIYVFELPQSD
jgi:alcohol dehydrogenase (cytochrome c)